jgi:hypothetical protein
VCALAQDFLQEQEHLKIREKMRSGKSCSKEIRGNEVELL